ncbi:MAG: hypothetical protein OXG15_09790 [Gammaproteobacteria bacterium]|nr:hypothetical protein [Gammaproteobacteria bacterium]
MNEQNNGINAAMADQAAEIMQDCLVRGEGLEEALKKTRNKTIQDYIRREWEKMEGDHGDLY